MPPQNVIVGVQDVLPKYATLTYYCELSAFEKQQRQGEAISELPSGSFVNQVRLLTPVMPKHIGCKLSDLSSFLKIICCPLRGLSPPPPAFPVNMVFNSEF